MLFSTLQLSGLFSLAFPTSRKRLFGVGENTGNLHIYNEIISFFNFAEEQQEKQRNVLSMLLLVRSAESEYDKKKNKLQEYAVDAWALKADEGRGDRRNVQGELHASEEP